MGIKNELTKGEKNILLYLETCLVDSRGFIQPARMNDTDWEIMDGMKEGGLIDFGRRLYKDIRAYSIGAGGAKTHWVKFSDQAWQLAHKCRQERGERHVDTLEK